MQWLHNIRGNLIGDPLVADMLGAPNWLKRSEHAWMWRGTLALVIAGMIGIGGYWIGEGRGKYHAETELRSLMNTLVARPIALDSQSGWQPTHLVVQEGDQVYVDVVGGSLTAWHQTMPKDMLSQLPTEIRASLPNNVVTGPAVDGFPLHMPTGVVARIGTGEPMSIGTSKTFIAHSTGEISLCINEGQSVSGTPFSNNADVLAVQILIRR